jgi:hypothetical protein
MEHTSAAIYGNYTNQKGPRQCIRYKIGLHGSLVYSRVAADIKIHTYGSAKHNCDYYGVVEQAN